MMNQVNYLKQPTGSSLEQWEKCPKPNAISMIGQYCTVTKLVPSVHAESLYQVFSASEDEGDWTYMAYGPFKDLRDFTDWLYLECINEDPLFYVIIDNLNGKAVGLASYLRIEPAIGVIEVGHIHFSPILQKTPMATEAMYLMMRYAFEELGYRRYEWKCDDCNENSKRAALRLGFKSEGTFRQATIYKGRNRDTTWFSMLDSEWPQQKAALEHWLQPSNFDCNNIQHCSLQTCI
jgi:RimJ/RimL family protein N-acetyltransferase